jgi:hypothetical protein
MQYDRITLLSNPTLHCTINSFSIDYLDSRRYDSLSKRDYHLQSLSRESLLSIENRDSLERLSTKGEYTL